MTGSEALAGGVRRLKEAGVPEAAGDARRLLAHALGADVGRLSLLLPEPVSLSVAEAYGSLLTRRAKRVPVSHLTGNRSFWGRDFLVNAEVLDPRPETEILIAAALEEPFTRVLDLGCGSGCILVTLLAERPASTGLGLDLSAPALEVAQTNAVRHGVSDRAVVAQSDWLAAAEGRFDLIVSNPPYIAASEMSGLEPEVRDWEPRLALTDGGDGLGAYRAILAGAPAHMAPGARLILEHGPGQSEPIAAIGQAAGWGWPEVRHDLDGRPRACVFRAP